MNPVPLYRCMYPGDVSSFRLWMRRHAAAAGTVVLFILAPTGTGYEDGRITAYRRICRLVCAVSLLTAIIMFVFKVYSAASGIAAGIIAESLLCLAEILKEHRATTK